MTIEKMEDNVDECVDTEKKVMVRAFQKTHVFIVTLVVVVFVTKTIYTTSE
jgi:hypothetical protein